MRGDSRATQGVTLISVDEGTSLTGVQCVVESESDEDELESGDGGAQGESGPPEGGGGDATEGPGPGAQDAGH